MIQKNELPFKIAINTSTLAPFALDVVKQVKLATQSGYAGIELWLRDIVTYVNNGGKLTELRNLIADSGLEVVDGIAFAKWADADKVVGKDALEQAKKEMQMLEQIGCKAIAAPPCGNVKDVTLDQLAERFSKLYSIGEDLGVKPSIEVWGHAAILNRMSHAIYIALESRVKNPQLVLDVFHAYKGGDDFGGVRLLNGKSIGVVHVNDYSVSIPRDIISDVNRVFPGDGDAPYGNILSDLKSTGYSGYLSLELFIKDYGQKDALAVAKEGYDKVKNLMLLSTT